MTKLFANRRMLLIYDNADKGEDVLKLIPISNACSVIITTRNSDIFGSLNIPYENSIKVKILDNKVDSRNLFSKLIGFKLDESELIYVDKLAELVNYVPLLIKIIAISFKNKKQNRKNINLEKFTKKLESRSNLLDRLKVLGNSELNYETSLDFTWDILDNHEEIEDIKSFFSCLSVCASEGFSFKIAAAAGKHNNHWDQWDAHDYAEDYLDKLCNCSLLQEENNRYVFHPMIREYARKIATKRGLIRAAKERHAKYILEAFRSLDSSTSYFSSVTQYSRKFENGKEDLEINYKFDTSEELLIDFEAQEEINDIIIAAKWLLRNEEANYQFGNQLNSLFEIYGYWEEATFVMYSYMVLAEKQADWEKVIIYAIREIKFITLQGKLSIAECKLDNVYKYFQLINSDSNRKKLKIRWQLRYAKVLQLIGSDETYGLALQYCQSAVKLAQELNDIELLRNSLNSLFKLEYNQKNYDNLSKIYRDLVCILEKTNNYEDLVRINNVYEKAMLKINNFEQADIALQKVKKYSDFDKSKWLHNSDLRIAITHVKNRQIDDAWQRFSKDPLIKYLLSDEEQLSIQKMNKLLKKTLLDGRTTKDYKHILGIALLYCGKLLQDKNMLVNALQAYKMSYTFRDFINNLSPLIGTLRILTKSLSSQKKFEHAHDAASLIVEISKNIKDTHSLATGYNIQGKLFLQQEKLEQARNKFESQIKIGISNNDQKQVVVGIHYLTSVLINQKKIQDIQIIFDNCIENAKDIEYTTHTIGLKLLAEKLREKGYLYLAENSLRRCYDLYAEKLDNFDKKIHTLFLLGKVQFQAKKFSFAYNSFNEILNLNKTKEINIDILAKVYIEIGKTLLFLERNEDAYYSLLKGFKIYKNKKNTSNLIEATIELSYALARLDLYAIALDNCTDALNIVPQNSKLLILQGLLSNRDLIKEGFIKHTPRKHKKNNYRYGYIYTLDKSSDIYFREGNEFKNLDSNFISKLKMNTHVKVEIGFSKNLYFARKIWLI